MKNFKFKIPANQKKLIKKLAALIIFGPVVIFIRAIRPFYKIQLMITPCTPLGHQAGNLEIHLIKTLIHKPKRTTYIYFCPNSLSKPVTNKYLHSMWARTLPNFIKSLLLTRILLILTALSWKMPFCDVVVDDIWIKKYGAADKDTTGKILEIPPFLQFTKKEMSAGEMLAEKMGITKHTKYVLLNNRVDPSQGYRNSAINSFFSAAQHLNSHGYKILRMGITPEGEMPNSINYIIDYAAKHRTEFMDLYLSSNTAFYLGDSCGLFNLSVCFRNAIALTNQTPILFAPFYYEKCLVIFKKYWLKNESRYMTLSEIMRSKAGYFALQKEYEESGIELHDNTPDEILDLANEMHQRLNGLYEETAEDLMIQSIMKEKLMADSLLMKVNGCIKAKVATSFLKRNPFYLE